jgi:hypothetical protein
VKARLLSYYEIEERFKGVLAELGRPQLDERSIVEKGGELLFLLGVCISQMEVPNSTSYPEKSRHLANLKKASAAITYKINTCTVDEVATQVTSAYQAFSVH